MMVNVKSDGNIVEESGKPVKLVSIIKAAEDLISRYGTGKVTVKDICLKAGVSRVTFYKYFKNRIELFSYILEKMFNQWDDEFFGVLESDAPFLSRIERFIEMKLEASEIYGEEFISELYYKGIPELENQVREYFEKVINRFMRFLQKGQEEGYIRKNIRPDFILILQEYLQRIFMDERSRHIYPKQTELIQEILNIFFFGILTRQNR